MIGIYNYSSTNNTVSLINALSQVTSNIKVSEDYKSLLDKDKIILPGIGNMKTISKLDIQKIRKTLTQYIDDGGIVYGICLGGQFLLEYNMEANRKTLGLLKGEVIPLSLKSKPYLNVGFFKTGIKKKKFINKYSKKIFKGIQQGSKFYYLHKYIIKCEDKSADISFTNNSNIKIPAYISKKNIIISQFHPELSRDTGLKFLENFYKL